MVEKYLGLGIAKLKSAQLSFHFMTAGTGGGESTLCEVWHF